MKKITLGILMILTCSVNAQKKKERYSDILNTSDIQKIEAFLKTAHPEDPRRIVLKPKLTALKNKRWTEGAKNAKPMPVRPILMDMSNTFITNPNSDESEEFTKLMTETSDAHKEKTVKILNQLFDNDPSNSEAIVLVQNNSDCNMIMRIQGKDYYNLAVPAKGENTILVKKGNYSFASNVCGSKYSSSKTIEKSMMILLNGPVHSSSKPALAVKPDNNKKPVLN